MLGFRLGREALRSNPQSLILPWFNTPASLDGTSGRWRPGSSGSQGGRPQGGGPRDVPETVRLTRTGGDLLAGLVVSVRSVPFWPQIQ